LFWEVSEPILIIVAFVVVGVTCARRLNNDLPPINVDGAASARQLRLHIVGTAAFAFVTLLMRAVYSTMFALCNELQDIDGPCNKFCDAACSTTHTPTLSNGLPTRPSSSWVLISCPLALLVALWGMTSERTLQLMQSNRRQMADMLVHWCAE
jgi:hypothetical protein